MLVLLKSGFQENDALLKLLWGKAHTHK